MKTDKPLISILLAVYKPNERWLYEQLKSLNKQTYPNLELLVCDDCPEHQVAEKIFRETITNFRFKVFKNKENLGSNKTFEKLTELANGKYISYCDQDDVWYHDKLQKMEEVLEKTGSPLVCSDLAIIDGEGNKILDSITELHKKHVFLEGDGLASHLLVSNFVTGCAMMVRTEIAKASAPFVDTLLHDHWIAINAAINGRIEVIREPLIAYRQHGSNQTAVMKGIYDKKSYYDERLVKYLPRLAEYRERLYFGGLETTIDDLMEFYQARIRYSEKINFRDLKIMFRHRHFAKNSVLAESVMRFIPEPVFRMAIELGKRGKI